MYKDSFFFFFFFMWSTDKQVEK